MHARLLCSVPLWSSHVASTKIITAVRGSAGFWLTAFPVVNIPTLFISGTFVAATRQIR
jgi:hypothetical protein